jgi:hypothetical protein
MEAPSSYKMLVTTYQTTLYHNPEDYSLQHAPNSYSNPDSDFQHKLLFMTDM